MTENTPNFDNDTDFEVSDFEDVDTSVTDAEFELEDTDTPDAEIDEVPGDTAGTAATSDPSTAKAPKETKAKRAPVPDGYITPVAAAKQLSEHLIKEGKLAEGEAIAPQIMYSYVTQGKKVGAKDPLVSYEEGGRQNLLKWTEVLEWWNRKEARKVERETAKAAKAAKAKDASKAPTAEAPTGPVTEAE